MNIFHRSLRRWGYTPWVQLELLPNFGWRFEATPTPPQPAPTVSQTQPQHVQLSLLETTSLSESGGRE